MLASDHFMHTRRFFKLKLEIEKAKMDEFFFRWENKVRRAKMKGYISEREQVELFEIIKRRIQERRNLRDAATGGR